MLEALKDTGHEQHEETLEWIGEEFDPELFDKEMVNKLLNKHVKYKNYKA
jgi:hypothetical protein